MLEKIYECTIALKGLSDQIERSLAQHHVSFHVEFGESKYDFFVPSTPEEAEQMIQKRKELSRALIADALKTIIEHGIPDANESLFQRVWDRIAQFKTPSVEEIASPIDALSYEQVKQEAYDTVRTLNPDLYTTTMERSDLTEEERQEKLNQLAEKGTKDAS